jgi:hypothetical protein
VTHPEGRTHLTRLERFRRRLADRRALRADRKLHDRPDVGDAARRAEGQAWSKGGYFTR